LTGWVRYLEQHGVCLARAKTANAGLPSEYSYFEAACRRATTRERIEYCGTRRALRAGHRVARRHGSLALRKAPAKEFISVRQPYCGTPMNRSLDWGSQACGLQASTPRVGRVANFGHSIFTL